MTISRKINEKQLIKIVEERGVAISPYKKEIDTIAMFIRSEVKKRITNGINKVGDEISFYVPQTLTNCFTFLGDLQILVNSRYTENTSIFGYGDFGSKPDGEIFYDVELEKLYNSHITINCFYNKKGKVYLRTVLTNLYYEFNHSYDEWIDVHSTKNFHRYNKSSHKSVYGINKINSNHPYIGMCIYRLFSETEYNALVASVFGDLQGINSNFSSFNQDYKKTQAYYVYNTLKTNLTDDLNTLTINEYSSLKNDLNDLGISLNMKENNLHSFKIAFISKADKLLNELLHDIGRVASLYYDNLSEKRNKKSVLIYDRNTF